MPTGPHGSVMDALNGCECIQVHGLGFCSYWWRSSASSRNRAQDLIWLQGHHTFVCEGALYMTSRNLSQSPSHILVILRYTCMPREKVLFVSFQIRVYVSAGEVGDLSSMCKAVPCLPSKGSSVFLFLSRSLLWSEHARRKFPVLHPQNSLVSVKLTILNLQNLSRSLMFFSSSWFKRAVVF